MNTATLSTFFAMLALACVAGTVVVVAIAVSAARRGPTSPSAEALATIGRSALWVAGLVAATAMAGSLYYSLVAGYDPCELCWYQRICMYPLAALLIIAAIRDDRQVWRYTTPLAVVGVGIAAYHTQLQAFPDQRTFCSLNNPCTLRFVWEFGFVSLPFMALVAFIFILTLVAVAARTDSSSTSFSKDTST